MIQFFKQYIPYYKDYKLKFLLSFIGILLVALGTSGTAYIIKPLLDEIFINKDEAMLAIIPLIVISLYTAKGIGKFLQVYYISYIGQDIIKRVRDKLLKHILSLDLAYFNSNHSGELISRITNDINRIQSAISNQVASMIQEVLIIISLIGVVVYQNAELAFYGLVVLPATLYPLSLMAKRMKKLSFRSQEKNSDITTQLSETFSNIEIIKANNAQNLELEKFKSHNQEFFNINIKAVKVNELVSPFMEIVGSIAVAVVIIVGGSQVINGQMTVGTFFSFMTALFMVYTPLKSLSSLYNKLQDAIAANERLNNILALKSEILSGDEEFPKSCNKITFNNVSLKFGDIVALNDISFKINKGETIALVGDSGGGKTSLINTLIRFYDTTNGDITIDNKNIKDITLKSLRDSISIVTQRVYIFNDTIGKNIAYGETYNENRVIKALKLAQAFEFVNELENGIDTILDESGTNISGGQRQRISIARALYKEPKILILDEATSALDNKSESVITELLEELSGDRITFVIAHRLSTIKYANKIAVFKAGNIVSFGSEEDLLKTSSEYKRLYSLENSKL
ncbi:MAG: ABC transporter ATP-binding protein [Campylobacterota bacterium]|nr:ABC transporter ATP-binding protein [Campylobacterota bacterium]